MTQYELQIALALAAGVDVATVRVILDAFAETAKTAMKSGDTINLEGIGYFYRGVRLSRWGRNPRTNEVIRIRAAKVPALMYRKKYRMKLREEP